MLELEYMECPLCHFSIDKWTIKVEVIEGIIGVRCPKCMEPVRLVVKLGDQETKPKKEQ